MAILSARHVRRAVLPELKADAALTALVAAPSIYPQAPPANPAWPFIKWGSPTGIPLTASCLDGQDIIVALHGFSKGRRSGNRLLESAEDHAGRIAEAMAAAIDGKRLSIPRGYATVQVTGDRSMQDGAEADAWHVVVNLRIRCLTA